ncbi:unnamed protein product [Mytilus edulis]|uniref:DUF5641 domain-containing protein n=1 Tax=Mytilus edulis TaxID=6550 RepID=A0A8S3U9U7_MYTED|nr:unnamed protein product [Mytilus edulis]
MRMNICCSNSLWWSIVGYTSSTLDVNNVKGISHRTPVTELRVPPLVIKYLVNALEGEFAHDKGNLKKLSQEDITFLSIMDDNNENEDLRTVFYEVMLIVNSRPLTVSEIDDPRALEPLTPNHILTAKSEIPSSPQSEFVKREYIAQISIRQKWHKPVRNMCFRDIVLVKDVELPRNHWPLAKVVEVKVDDDRLVRRVKVMLGQRGSTKPSVLERSVHKLVLLM